MVGCLLWLDYDLVGISMTPWFVDFYAWVVMGGTLGA